MTVSRVGMTYVIEIGFKSIDPDRAAQIANAVADGFIVDQLEAKYQTIREATAWLQDRLNELRGQASAAERAVVEYKTKNNIVDTGGRLINEQQLAELNTALIKARADEGGGAGAARSRHADTSRRRSRPGGCELRNGHGNIAKPHHHLSYVSNILSSRNVRPFFQIGYGNNHLAVVNLRNRMHEIRRSIVDELKQIAEAYKSDYDIAKARENSLEKSLAATVAGSQTTNKAQIELRQLESAAQTYRALYDNFQQRYMDSVQQQSLPMTEARVITRASPPSAKSFS